MTSYGFEVEGEKRLAGGGYFARMKGEMSGQINKLSTAMRSTERRDASLGLPLFRIIVVVVVRFPPSSSSSPSSSSVEHKSVTATVTKNAWKSVSLRPSVTHGAKEGELCLRKGLKGALWMRARALLRAITLHRRHCALRESVKVPPLTSP